MKLNPPNNNKHFSLELSDNFSRPCLEDVAGSLRPVNYVIYRIWSLWPEGRYCSLAFLHPIQYFYYRSSSMKIIFSWYTKAQKSLYDEPSYHSVKEKTISRKATVGACSRLWSSWSSWFINYSDRENFIEVCEWSREKFHFVLLCIQTEKNAVNVE